MIDSIFRHVLVILPVIIIASFLPYLVSKDSRDKLETDETGREVLKYSKIYGMIGWACVLVTGILTIMGAVFSSESFAGEQLIWLSFFGLGLIIGVPLILLKRNSRIVLDDQKIEWTSMFGRKKVMTLTGIQTVKINPYSQTLTFGDGTQVLGINMGMKGFNTFLDTLRDKFNPSLLESLQREMNKLSKEYQH